MTTTVALNAISFHLDKLDAVFSLSHTLAIIKGENDFHFFKKLAKNECLLFALETLSLLSTTIFVAIKAEQSWGLVKDATQLPEAILVSSLVAPALFMVGSMAIVIVVSKVALRNIQLKENEYRPTKRLNELYVQFRRATHILMHLGAICFAPTNPFILFSAVSGMYSLYKIAKGKWTLITTPGQEAFFSFPQELMEASDNITDIFRSNVIQHHLSGKDNFTLSLSSRQIRPLRFVEKWLSHLEGKLKNRVVWHTSVLKTVSFLGGIFAYSFIGSSLKELAHRIEAPLKLCMYTKSAFDLAIPKMHPMRHDLLFLSLVSIGTAISYLREYYTKSKGQQELSLHFRCEPLKFDRLVCRELRNQVSGDNTWQDPITFEDLSENKILSPATLIIDKMAFAVEPVLLRLFCHPEDENNNLSAPNCESLRLYHPIYRHQLSLIEQDSVVDQICRTFMISSSDFTKCWKLDSGKALAVQRTSMLRSVQLKEQISDEDMEGVSADFTMLLELARQHFPYEFDNYMKSQIALCFQLIRFHNFCQLLPEEIREKLKENLSTESVEKLRIIDELA